MHGRLFLVRRFNLGDEECIADMFFPRNDHYGIFFAIDVAAEGDGEVVNERLALWTWP